MLSIQLPPPFLNLHVSGGSRFFPGLTEYPVCIIPWNVQGHIRDHPAGKSFWLSPEIPRNLEDKRKGKVLSITLPYNNSHDLNDGMIE
jgi:hypothetical protein